MKKQFLILFAFISVLTFGQVPQRFNKVIVTGDITSPKFIKTGSNADSVLLGNGSARSVNSIKTDTVSLSNRINAKATGNGTANGTNTGDETLTSIKTKLGAATSVSDGYLRYQDWNTFNSKEPSFSKNTAFNKNFGTTSGTVLEGRTFGTAANSAVGDFQPTITGLTTNNIVKWNGSSFVNATSGTDYQLPITLTTNGTSGAATFENGVMNVPNYTSSATSGAYGPIITLLSGLASYSTPAALYTYVGSVTHAALTGGVTTNTTGMCSFRFTLPSSIIGNISIIHVYVFGYNGNYIADAYVTHYVSDSIDLHFNSTSPPGSEFAYSIMVDYY